MTNLKDKLSASVRRAKATQQPETETPGAENPAPAAEPAAVGTGAAKPASVKPATPRAAAVKPAAKSASASKSATKPTPATDIPESGSALFPARVWPD